MSDQNENSEAQLPRSPRNLQGLLKYVMEVTKDQDRTQASRYNQLKPEDRKFIEKALKAITLDVVGELNQAMKVLMDSDASKEEKVESLKTIRSFVEDIDTANDFCRIGGYSIILPCLNSEHPEIRIGTASLISELAQNNDYCQRCLLDLDILPKLIELLTDEPEVSTQAFQAISCLVRNFEPGLDAFMKLGGMERLLTLIQDTSNEKMVIKALFLMNSIGRETSKIRKDLIALNVIEKIAANMIPTHEYSTKLEQELTVFLTLMEEEEGIQQIRDEKHKIKEKLHQNVSLGKGKEDCLDQVQTAEIFSDWSSQNKRSAAASNIHLSNFFYINFNV